MTPKEAKKLERTLPPCKCGGKLFISGYTRESYPDTGLVHLVIRCKRCKEWHGGFTRKIKRQGD